MREKEGERREREGAFAIPSDHAHHCPRKESVVK
jgi:hypothetical protein